MNKGQLRAFRAQAKEMGQLRESLERLQALKGPKITKYDNSPGGGGDGQSPVESSVERIIALEDKYHAMLAQYAHRRILIEEAIADLAPNEKAVIRSYYLDCLTWEETAYNLHFSYQHTHRLHASALIHLSEKEKK